MDGTGARVFNLLNPSPNGEWENTPLANCVWHRSVISLKTVCTNVALRTATAIVALFAWMVLSNHCALALMFPVKSSPIAAAEPSCCKGQPRPADGDAPCPQMPQGCCKTLKVAMPDAAKIPQATLTPILPVVAEWFAALALAMPEKRSAITATGPPPDSPTFVELVLNRSLLSHAPPVSAS